MPDAGTDSVWRGGRLLTGLFWFGVGLAPLAGLLLLLGGGGASLRVAGVLAVLAVVLIGLSVALRPDLSTVRLQLEETLLEEVDAMREEVREEVREEIRTAARDTHQSIGERIGSLQQQLEAVRTERGNGAPAAGVAAARATAPAAPPPIGRAKFTPPPSVAPPYSVAPPQPPAPQPAPPGRSAPPRSAPPRSVPPRSASPRSAPPRAALPRSASPRSAPPRSAAPPRSVAPPQSVAPPYSAAPQSPPVSTPVGPPGRQPPPPVSAPAANGRASVGPAGGGRNGAGRRTAARHQAEPPPRRSAPTGRANVSGGVYRRTETVQVTRSTSYVDEPHPERDRDRLYDTGYHSRHEDDAPDWSARAPRSRAAEPLEESWTDQKLRERYGGRRPRPHDTNGDGAWNRDDDERWRPISAEPVSGEVLTGEPISAEPRSRRSHRWDEDDDPAGVRIGERWAAVRADERGRELRVGERRTARHSDETGTELRVEDRWAAVRHEDNGYETNGYETNGRHSNGRNGSGRHSNGRHSAAPDTSGPDYGRPALPAGRSEPSWNDSWEEPVRESRGHRYRDDDSNGHGYSNGTPHQRRLDFELSDERWR